MALYISLMERLQGLGRVLKKHNFTAESFISTFENGYTILIPGSISKVKYLKDVEEAVRRVDEYNEKNPDKKIDSELVNLGYDLVKVSKIVPSPIR